jgi:hypothetical protein
LERIAPRLAEIPGVEAVALGGSRAWGAGRDDSDWDFGLYYRGDIDVAAVRALGFEGEIVEPGRWGRLVNGGAWLVVDGRRVDLLYRDLDFVRHWTEEAEVGRFEVDLVEGYVAGMATYVLAGELALAKVLVGELPRPRFPDALREAAPSYWRRSAEHSLLVAGHQARTGDVAGCAGLLAKAAIAVAQARLAARGEWALNEKGIVRRAGLAEAANILAAPGRSSDELAHSVLCMKAALSG